MIRTTAFVHGLVLGFVLFLALFWIATAHAASTHHVVTCGNQTVTVDCAGDVADAVAATRDACASAAAACAKPAVYQPCLQRENGRYRCRGNRRLVPVP